MKIRLRGPFSGGISNYYYILRVDDNHKDNYLDVSPGVSTVLTLYTPFITKVLDMPLCGDEALMGLATTVCLNTPRERVTG